MLLLMTTFGGREQALEVAYALVREQLAACVSLTEMRSVYRWKGEVEESNEVSCLIKTTEEAFERLRARLVELHPYELPELIAWPITAGHQPYLDWVVSDVK